MKLALYAAAALLGSYISANAVQIISFGQTSASNTVTITANGAGTQTTIGITDASILIDQLFGAVTPPAISAVMDLTATARPHAGAAQG